MTRLSGKVALITGGASGLGREIAIRMSQEGARVALADINERQARAVAAEITGSGGDASAYPVDVSQSSSVHHLVRSVLGWSDRIDILVNCAGVSGGAPFLDMTEAEWDRVIGINLKGTFLMCQRVGRVMRDAGGGAIINLSSVLAEVSRATAAHYGASKGGVRQLTQAAALALAPHGIRVNAIAPGPCETPLTAAAYADPAIRADALARVPLRRAGTPQDVAGAAVYLASEDAAWVTGTTLHVDGGLLAAR